MLVCWVSIKVECFIIFYFTFIAGYFLPQWHPWGFLFNSIGASAGLLLLYNVFRFLPLTSQLKGSSNYGIKWRRLRKAFFPSQSLASHLLPVLSLDWLGHFLPATTLRALTLYVHLSLLRFHSCKASCKTCPLLPGLCEPPLPLQRCAGQSTRLPHGFWFMHYFFLFSCISPHF